MSVILTADIHLNNKPLDEYRWGLFDWLCEQKANELIICGDLTDAHDRHNAVLVNRFYDSIHRLVEAFDSVIIIRGNHDAIDPTIPFFGFLGSSGGFLGSDNILFINEPKYADFTVGKALLVPALARWDFKIPDVVDYIFTHATFTGSKAENGTILTGVNPSVVKDFKGKVWAGDIHVPQKLAGGKIEYVGAPYHTRFGDTFEPRLVYISDDGKTKDLYFPAPKKHTVIITEPDHLLEEKYIKSGDQVKVRCLLYRSQFDLWSKYKEEIKAISEKKGWVLCGMAPASLETTTTDSNTKLSSFGPVSAETVLREYAKAQKADDRYVDIGLELIQ